MTKKQLYYFSTTLEKGLRILNLFNQDRMECSQSEVSKLTGINMTSTYRFVNTFVELGFLNKNPETKILKLGPKAISMGHGFLRGFDFVQMIKPIVDETCDKYRINIDTALLDSDSLLIIYRRETNNALPYQLPTIIKNLNSTALGKAVLAFLPKEKMDKIVNELPFEHKTSKTILDKKKLYQELKTIKERGYSLNNEEFVPGLIALGAPLVNVNTKKTAGAICFDFLVSQYSQEEIEKKYSGLIIDLAKKISQIIPTM